MAGSVTLAVGNMIGVVAVSSGTLIEVPFCDGGRVVVGSTMIVVSLLPGMGDGVISGVREVRVSVALPAGGGRGVSVGGTVVSVGVTMVVSVGVVWPSVGVDGGKVTSVEVVGGV